MSWLFIISRGSVVLSNAAPILCKCYQISSHVVRLAVIWMEEWERAYYDDKEMVEKV